MNYSYELHLTLIFIVYFLISNTLYLHRWIVVIYTRSNQATNINRYPNIVLPPVAQLMLIFKVTLFNEFPISAFSEERCWDRQKETLVLNPYLQHLCLTVISLKDKTIAKDLNKRSRLGKKWGMGLHLNIGK